MTTMSKTVRTQKKALTTPVNIRLTAEEITKVENYAAKQMRSRASFLRLLVINRLEQYKA